jgi:hypothetical protein
LPALKCVNRPSLRDYRYVRYVAADAELTLAAEVKPTEDGVAQ